MIEERASKERMSDPVRVLWEKYYPESRRTRFEDLLDRNIEPSHSVLEIGAGSGRKHQNHFAFRGRVARYVGVDPEPSVETNPYLDEGYRAKADSLPFADSSFDLVFHHLVAEHLESPYSANCEIARVLKPGGTLLFLTPSRFYYACLAAQLTPHWFHELYVQRLGSGRTSDEVFPTFYRLNDDRAIASQLRKCGFACEIEHQFQPPGYLRFSRASFLAGVAFQKTLEKWFPSLRATIIVTARKQFALQSS
jgi:SAM-dependent methyltransferase